MSSGSVLYLASNNNIAIQQSTVILNQQQLRNIARDVQQYIGRQNYSKVPMEANVELFASYEPIPDHAASHTPP
jgi:hypothetical protein